MAQGLYKSDAVGVWTIMAAAAGGAGKSETIKFTYQAANAQTSLTVTIEIFDETGAKDVVTFPDVVLVETGTSGQYVGSFTPVVKQYDVIELNTEIKIIKAQKG